MMAETETEKKIVGGGRCYCVCCSNYRGKKVDGRTVTLHKVPTDKSRRRVWVKRLKLVRKDFAGLKANTHCCWLKNALKRKTKMIKSNGVL